MRSTRAIGLVIVIVCALALGCSAQNSNCVSVRVLKIKNAKPIKDAPVQMWFFEAESYWRPDKVIDIGKTDKSGIARYCIPDPVPKSFRLQFDEFDGPDERTLFETESVLKNGVVVTNPPNKKKNKNKNLPNPKAGEIVVFGERWWLIDRWLGPWP
jgi:hypothetical protein